MPLEPLGTDFSTSRKFFLDLDGTVADFLTPFAAYHGRRNPYDAPWRAAGKGSDFEFEAWLRNPRNWTSGVLSTPGFWDSLPVYPWAHGIIRAARAWGSLVVLTSPGRDGASSAAASGKLKWCLRALRIPAKDVVLCARKELLAGPGRVLLDDYAVNIDAWRSAGGVGLLFPQPYNSNYKSCSRDPVEWLKEKLS